ncbi:MAG: dTMP kinase [Actinomycetota bacterium]|nr:dTMP kinase [Actinomycetota bacterium]
MRSHQATSKGGIIQEAPKRSGLQVVTASEQGSGYASLFRNGNFVRFFSAQAVSSLGDWIGVIAIAVFAQTRFGTIAVGVVMMARVLPGFLVGPLAGVLADRWDRKKTMVAADLSRSLLVFSLPFVPNLAYFIVVSALLESLTLLWGPAKDSSLPHFVERSQLTHANSLSLIAIYGPWPLASILFASLTGLGSFVGDHVEVMRGLSDSPEAMALWVDAVTFAFSAAMVSTLAIPSSKTGGGRFDLKAIKRDLIEGLQFVGAHKQVRPWMLGIAFTFTAAGGVFSLGPEFTSQILNSGPSAYGFIIGSFGSGMIVGLLASGLVAKHISKDVLFSSSVILLGVGLILLASMSSVAAVVPIAAALGFFGGVGYSVGYALMQETSEEELRGRTFGAVYTLIRIGTLIGLGVFPLIAGAIGDNTLDLVGGATLALPGSRVTWWLAGLLVIGGGILSTTAIGARRSPGALQAVRNSFFVVFEGGEGAGKSTQMAAFVRWLQARGDDVVVTREPGGTPLGKSLREALLDSSSSIDARAEALLFAADRAQHAAEVIKPALAKGKIVVSDRFLDSSLAYQGLARGLGLDEIYELSAWATGGLVPDLVVLLTVDSETSKARLSGERDRLEREGDDFHEKVAAAYLELSSKFSDRYVVLDGARPASEVHEDVVAAFEERSIGRVAVPGRTYQAAPGPVPR